VERCLACEAVVSRVKIVTPPFHALQYVVSPRRPGLPHLAKTRSRNLNSIRLGKQQSARYSRALIYVVSLFTTASQARQSSTVRPTLSLHPDDLVTAIDIDHLARDRGGSITRQKHPGLT
jgi:hypothetical protein